MPPLKTQPNLTERVYQRILSDIVGGELPELARLIQDDLARDLGVSRQPVQQALLLLRESIGKERRPLSWVVGDQGVYRANMQSERERKRGERIAVTNLRTPDEI